MRKYEAGKDELAAASGDARDWVFDLLRDPRYRERIAALEQLDLVRRPGCEPCLRALVMNQWDHDSLYHLGWCQSCRSASLAIGMETAAKTVRSSHRRHALIVVLAAGVAIAAPIAGSKYLDSRQAGPSSSPPLTGGQTTTPSTATTPGSTSTTPGSTSTTPGSTSTTPASTSTTPASTTTTPTVTPVPRSRSTKGSSSGGRKRTLPLTP